MSKLLGSGNNFKLPPTVITDEFALIGPIKLDCELYKGAPQYAFRPVRKNHSYGKGITINELETRGFSYYETNGDQSPNREYTHLMHCLANEDKPNRCYTHIMHAMESEKHLVHRWFKPTYSVHLPPIKQRGPLICWLGLISFCIDFKYQRAELEGTFFPGYYEKAKKLGSIYKQKYLPAEEIFRLGASAAINTLHNAGLKRVTIECEANGDENEHLTTRLSEKMGLKDEGTIREKDWNMEKGYREIKVFASELVDAEAESQKTKELIIKLVVLMFNLGTIYLHVQFTSIIPCYT